MKGGGIDNYFLNQINNVGHNGFYFLTDYDIIVIATNTTKIFDANRIFYYQNHKEDILQFCDLLADEKSKEVLIAYVKSYMKNSVYIGEQIPAVYKYFFGSKKEPLYKHLDDECWINCGSSVGDTLFSYFRWNLSAKKIYAFEGDPNTFKKLIKNLSILIGCRKEALNILQPINAMIDERTDFKTILAGNKCTLLNADIEGNELKLLKAMEKIIINDRPVLSVCLYHLKEDIVVIPKYLKTILNDYVYCLRKYTPYVHNVKQNHELVLYAIPQERSLIEVNKNENDN